MTTNVEQPADEPPGALIFGSVAGEYERYRIGYPGEVVDAVLGFAGRPVASALEVGAGTGKATRGFASRGIGVTALEPDPDMASWLRTTTLGLPVTTVVSTFERFDAARRFDLLYAAAAWHWTDPRTRWSRAGDVVAPGGMIALFGRPCELSDPELHATVEDIERRHLPSASKHPGNPWSVDDITDEPAFTGPLERELPSVETTTADAFVRRLGTTSVYLLLTAQARADVVTRILDALPERVEVDTTTHLVMARRKSSGTPGPPDVTP